MPHENNLLGYNKEELIKYGPGDNQIEKPKRDVNKDTAVIGNSQVISQRKGANK